VAELGILTVLWQHSTQGMYKTELTLQSTMVFNDAVRSKPWWRRHQLRRSSIPLFFMSYCNM